MNILCAANSFENVVYKMAASCSGLWSWALNIHGQLGQWCCSGCPFRPFCSWFASVDTFGMIQMSTAKCFNPEFILGNIKYIFSMISEQWDGTDRWYIRPCLFCKVNIMAANNFWRGMFEIIELSKLNFKLLEWRTGAQYTPIYIYANYLESYIFEIWRCMDKTQVFVSLLKYIHILC